MTVFPNLASVAILSYNRAEFLADAIATARNFAGYPLEVIVHDDGSSDPAVRKLIQTLLDQRQISKLILSPPGHNQGVGESIRVAFGAASGDVLVKFDQDCIAQEDWLAKMVDVLWNVADVDGQAREVGMVGGFHYANLADERFRTIDTFDGWESVTDFVGSVFALKRSTYEKYGIDTHSEAFAEDWTLKQQLQADGYLLALPTDDVIVNRGFGVGPSTVALSEEPGDVQPIHHGAIVFNRD